MSFTELELEVLERVKPTKEGDRRIRAAVAALEAALKMEIAKEGLEVVPTLVGSIAKGTHLKDPDIDMFLLFKPDVPRKELERLGLKLAKAVMKGEERYAEHPYLHGTFQGYEADIVPSYKIDSPEQRMTAVDRTPFHTEFVKGRITQTQRDDVRLLKRFMKGTGTYGAEAKINGFSGYLVELLVLKYGSFRGVLEGAAKWRFGKALDLGVKGSREFGEPLVFIDPVDEKRNVAAALSGRIMALFMQASRDYLDKPSKKFFFPKEREVLSLSKINDVMGERGTDLVAFEYPIPELTEDTIFPQVKKSERALSDLLAQYDFEVVDSETHISGGNAIVILELSTATLPPVLRHEGPPADVENARDFVEKWRTSKTALSPPFLIGTKWYVDIKRKYMEPKALIETNLPRLDLGRNLNEVLREQHRILGTRELMKEKYRPALSALLDKRAPWLI